MDVVVHHSTVATPLQINTRVDAQGHRSADMAESTQSMPDACRAGASRSDASGRGPRDTGGEWSNKVDFFMAGISSTIGLGNLWRFPYQCYRNGGGE